MSGTRNVDAYILSHPYTFCPIPAGKYEFGDCDDPDLRWMMLAHANDKSAIYVKYDPAHLEE
ncbi:hypothetical protein ES703_43434 [subsurface metagenome]